MKLLKENINSLRKIHKLPEDLTIFLQNNAVQEALKIGDIDELYKLCNNPHLHGTVVLRYKTISNLTCLLYSIGIDPLLYLNYIPDNFLVSSSIKSIVIPGNMISIGRKAFSGCNNLISVIIDSGVKSIGDYAFFDCAKLVDVTIPDSVESIGFFAFIRCPQLTSIRYTGTKQAWGTIKIDSNWKASSPIITIHCIDGDIKP